MELCSAVDRMMVGIYWCFIKRHMLTLIYTGREGGEEGDGEGASGPHQGALQEPAGAEDQTQDEICGAARGVGFNNYT